MTTVKNDNYYKTIVTVESSLIRYVVKNSRQHQSK